MSKTYTAADGRTITDEMIDRWCEAYDKGEFPEGERTVGEVVHGRPPLSSEGTVVLSVKVPIGMKVALDRRAKSQGVSTSSLARDAIAKELLTAKA